MILTKSPNYGRIQVAPPLFLHSRDIRCHWRTFPPESEFGVDAYSVNGKTLGACGVAAYAGGKLWLHDAYDECEIIENGLYKSEFELTYNNVEVNGHTYKKTLRVTTSANGTLNKAVVNFRRD